VVISANLAYHAWIIQDGARFVFCFKGSLPGLLNATDHDGKTSGAGLALRRSFASPQNLQIF
jgi:hypothetical protein